MQSVPHNLSAWTRQPLAFCSRIHTRCNRSAVPGSAFPANAFNVWIHFLNSVPCKLFMLPADRAVLRPCGASSCGTLWYACSTACSFCFWALGQCIWFLCLAAGQASQSQSRHSCNFEFAEWQARFQDHKHLKFLTWFFVSAKMIADFGLVFGKTRRCFEVCLTPANLG